MEFPFRERVINILISNPQGITIAGISEILKVTRHTVTITLAELYGERMITIRRVGMCKLIYLNNQKEEILQ